IRWVLLLQEFDVEVQDKAGRLNLVADHLSRLAEPNSAQPEQLGVEDKFPDEWLFAVETKPNPWYADIVNFLSCRIMPPDTT
ncbi:hypothetical protein PSY30_23535, partial [Shigella flexneri]|nr:hypothetical protein [Shigella flexneri]